VAPAPAPRDSRRGAAAALQAAWWQPRPTLLATLLRPLSWLWRALAGIDGALSRPHPGPCPVVVVGNLVVGGAGKTPTVLALLKHLRQRGWTPGVVSRGHGGSARSVVVLGADSRAAEVGDEPLLIHRRGGAPVAVGADRVAAVQALCRQHPKVNIVLSDDGLQHHRMARDVQVMVFDERGAGNGLCLPAGPLRQPLPATVPPRTVVLYSGGTASTPLPGFAGRRRLAGVLPLEAWRRGDAPDPQIGEALRGRRLMAVAGIGVPERFFAMLRAAGLAVDGLALEDHHRFDALPWPDDPDLHVVLTEKDAVKLVGGSQTSKAHVWVAPLDFVPDPGFAEAIDRLLPATPSR
jgi:tetraacyldisaccharide 4'-kinase